MYYSISYIPPNSENVNNIGLNYVVTECSLTGSWRMDI